MIQVTGVISFAIDLEIGSEDLARRIVEEKLRLHFLPIQNDSLLSVYKEVVGEDLEIEDVEDDGERED